MVKKISRLGLYQELDKLACSVEEWLDAKALLDAEFLAEEANASVVVGAERDDEDLEEWIERQFA